MREYFTFAQNSGRLFRRLPNEGAGISKAVSFLPFEIQKNIDMKPILPIILICITTLAACTGGTEKPATNAAPATAPASTETPKTPLDELRERAIPEEDIMSRIEQGLAVIQGEFDRSAPKMPDLGKVTIDHDLDCNLIIRNEKDGNVYETRVNMNDLETGQGGFRLDPDFEPDDFPGLIVSTKNDAPKVHLFKNGKETTTDNELKIYLVDRPAIEKIAPALLQTIRICQDEIK
ncbi:MAG: hypothetical protein D6714_06790 [Bacteroidetes bacterium]|nr:MAG: hypothetical protein D6714_06790 [Bacteroidota bacterium]